MIQLILLFTLQAFAQFYPQSYTQSREHFLELAEEFKLANPEVELHRLDVPTATQLRLTTDALFIPQNNGKTERLLIVTSGTHGIEAFTGAALQFDLLTQYFDRSWLDHTAFLIVHAVNPYGYEFKRRVNENNVDLNRNFSAAKEHFESEILLYDKFDDFLNPKEPLSASMLHDIGLFIQSLKKLFFYGKKKITQIAVGGQYQNPKGIYFGGKEPQDNTILIKNLFSKIGNPFEKILHIDLHTGYGERGKLHLFSDRKLAEAAGFNKIFEGFAIDFGADKDFYKTSGDFGSMTFSLFAEKEVIIPMTFEFGTLDSQTIMGGFKSLRNMIYENQGHQFGFENPDSEKRTKRLFQEMFNPSDQSWREKVFKQSKESFQKIIKRFIKI